MILSKVRDFMKKTDAFHTKSYYENIIEELRNAKDSFFDIDLVVEGLKEKYEEYGKVIIAYDYDDTVCPSKPQYNCDNVVKLLRLCSNFRDFEMICYTARSTPKLIEEVKETLDRLGIRYDTINEDTPRVMNELEHTYTSKVLYGIFLDDKAGLGDAYRALVKFMDWYLDQQLMPE